MAKPPAYALFMFQMSNLKKQLADPEFEGCDEVLAYMAVHEADGLTLKITDLVQSLQFGTGPTVYRKVSTLVNRGLIHAVQNKNDARAKDLMLAPPGMAFLKERSQLLKKCLEV
ncbi:MAG: hypothetical protein ACOYBQ_09630 [Fluviibacter sp.]